MQPNEDSRMSRRLAGLSPMTVPLDNPNQLLTNPTNATNVQTTNDTPPALYPQPPPPPPPQQPTHNMPTGMDGRHMSQFTPIDNRQSHLQRDSSIHTQMKTHPEAPMNTQPPSQPI